MTSEDRRSYDMNKAEMVDAIAKKADLNKKQADAALKAFCTTVTEALQEGDKVALTGFGTFETRERAERQGINPSTKETITIKASKSPAFKASKVLKDALNQD